MDRISLNSITESTQFTKNRDQFRLLADSLELKGWILSWGKNTAVLEPEYFRTKIEMEIQEMYQR